MILIYLALKHHRDFSLRTKKKKKVDDKEFWLNAKCYFSENYFLNETPNSLASQPSGLPLLPEWELMGRLQRAADMLHTNSASTNLRVIWVTCFSWLEKPFILEATWLRNLWWISYWFWCRWQCWCVHHDDNGGPLYITGTPRLPFEKSAGRHLAMDRCWWVTLTWGPRAPVSAGHTNSICWPRMKKS